MEKIKELSIGSVLVLGINFSPELTGIGKYSGEMAKWLADQNIKTTVITSFPYYPNWKVQKPYTGRWYKKEISLEGNLTVYRCPMYVPKVPSGLKRMLHEASFFASSSCVIIRLLFKRKIDNIICIAPPFHLGFLALVYRMIKGGRINYHIQDLQIEAARDLKVVKSEAFFKVLFGLERFIFNRVNSISSISLGMMRKIATKSGKTIKFFPNWVDTKLFHPLENRNEMKSQWGFKPSDKIVLYSGSIGEKQGLDALIDISIECQSRSDIHIVICGTGPYKANLEQICKSKSVQNVHFFPLQDFNVFNAFLNMADVHLVLQKAQAADLVMPSKLSTILSSGGLVIATTFSGTSLYDEIVNNEMGIVIDPENNQLLQDAIISACTNDYSKERANARKYAERYLDQDSILQTMKNEILN
jgi:colanic acid biosynthesis glycosyl transferase WcaI